MNPNFYALAVVLRMLRDDNNPAVVPEPAFEPFDLTHLRKTFRRAHRPNGASKPALRKDAPELIAA
ncbi:MAG TPA: hypothetical protein VGD78_03960 [Chthoniobacterales bacterium]